MAQQKQEEDFLKKCDVFFKEADQDNSKALSVQELCHVLKRVGYKMDSNDEVIEIFMDIDKDDDDKVTYGEYMKEMGRQDPKKITECQLRAAFKNLDGSGDGSLSKDEMREAIVKYTTLRPDDESMAKLLDGTDENDDGKVTYEEFIAFYKTECLS